jgi:hypothetical protein
LDELTSSVYLLKSDVSHHDDPNKAPLLLANDVIPFLKSLNAINGTALTSLLDKATTMLTGGCKTSSSSPASINAQTLQIQELVYKFIVLICISGNDNTAKLVLTELLVSPPVDSATAVVQQPNPQETFLIKLRQEVNPFHEHAFSDCVRSVARSFEDKSRVAGEKEDSSLTSFLQNLVLVHEWDLQNPNFMT